MLSVLYIILSLLLFVGMLFIIKKANLSKRNQQLDELTAKIKEVDETIKYTERKIRSLDAVVSPLSRFFEKMNYYRNL